MAQRPTVVVRMAEPSDVFPALDPLPQPAHGHRARLYACEARGRPAPALYEPVVAFARAHLAEPGDEIAVDPRSDIGQLRVSAWFAGESYCLNVRSERGVTTIVIQRQGAWNK